MPVYSEPVAPLGPLYVAPVPRSGARAATDASFGGWTGPLASLGSSLAAGQANLGPAQANLASLDAGLAVAQDAWNNAGIVAGLTDDAEALNQPNPVGGPTIPLSLTVPQMPTTPCPVAGLGDWLRGNVYTYLYQLQSYLVNIGKPPTWIPPVG